MVSAERARNGNTFFAHRVIAFLPEQHQRRFRAPLRTCDFYTDIATCNGIWIASMIAMDTEIAIMIGIGIMTMTPIIEGEF